MSAENLWAILAGDGELRVHMPTHRTATWIPSPARGRFIRLLERLPEVQISPCLHRDRHPHSEHRAGVLWVHVETGESAALLAQFRPEPSMTLVHGQTVARTALWALQSPLDISWVHQANRRLAHKLKTPKKHADPQKMTLRWGTHLDGRELPVSCEIGHDAPLYEAAEVVGPKRPWGALVDPPKWRGRG